MEAETRTIEDVIAEFETCGHEPERARGNCVNESQRFAWALQEAGVEAFTIDGYTVLKDSPAEKRLAERFPSLAKFADVTITGGHTAVLVGDMVYDWTARQFYPHDQPVPLIQPLAEWRKTWREVL